MNTKLFFVDVETTGTNPDIHSIWQLAYKIEINGKIEYQDNLYMKPIKGTVYDKAALQHCNTNKKQLKKFPPQHKQFKKLLEVLEQSVDKFNPEDKLQLVAYNANFDKDFLRAWFKQNNHKWYDSFFFGNNLCTYNLASFVLKDVRYLMKNMQLSTVVKLFKISLVNAHDAAEDNEANYLLYYKLIKYIKTIK